MRRWAMYAVLAGMMLHGAVAAAEAGAVERRVDGDSYLAGYCDAVLSREFGLRGGRVWVADGVVRVQAPNLSHDQVKDIERVLGAIEGVKEVHVQRAQWPLDGVPSDAPATTAGGGDAASDTAPVTTAPNAATTPIGAAEGPSWFGRARVFEPLMADPRWPHFFASFTGYQNQPLDKIASVGFGETLAFYRDHGLLGGDWEVGLQAALHAIFDLDADSKDLLNADYMIGPYLAWRRGDWSALVRLFHQSSHLGDEFLLNNPGVVRVNYSFELLEALASWDLDDRFRLYGGAGSVLSFNVEPEGFDPLVLHYGGEFRARNTFLGRRVRPVAGLDVKQWEEFDWSPDLSVRGGVEIAHPRLKDSRLQLLLEFYNGRSPHGQFYVDGIQYYGLGMHFFW